MIEFKNFAKTRLAAGIGPGALSLSVSGGTGALFPSGGANYFYLILSDSGTGLIREIVKCTARATDTFTIVRAQGGTTAQSFSANDYVALGWTAESITDVVNQFLLTTSSPTFAGLTTSGTATFGAGSGSLVAQTVASAVNYIKASGAIAAGTPVLEVTGSDTNIAFNVRSKGTGAIALQPGAVTQLNVAYTASAVNYYEMTGAIASGSPLLAPAGADANISAVISSKGTASTLLKTGSGARTGLAVADVASSVNYLTILPSATGNAVQCYPAGSDTNIGRSMYSKGTGSVLLGTRAGTTQLAITDTASSVNYWTMTGSATGNKVSISATGTDTNIGLTSSTKGNGSHVFATNAGAQTQLTVSHTASAVNYLTLTGSATTVNIPVAASGSDTNIGIQVDSKGTGSLLFRTNATQSLGIDGTQNVYVGTAAIATGATAGFFWIPSMAGAPSGAPTAPYSNAAALVADTTNNRLYVRVGAAWKYAALT